MDKKRRQYKIIALAVLVALAITACSPTSSDVVEALPELQESDPTPISEAIVTIQPTENIAPTLEAKLATSEEKSDAISISEKDAMQQIYIPAGEFIMGSEDEDAKKTKEGGVAWPEIPEHEVYLDGYWIDKYEISNSQYKLCVDEGICVPPFYPVTFMGIEYYANPDYSNYPVTYVDWYLARDYCEWAGRRLPTEAEWEKAARGVGGEKYTWGNEPISNERANFCDGNCPKSHADINFDDGYAEPAPVGSYPAGASPYGIMDMAGNVWEWTSTIPQPYPYDLLDGREEPDLREGEDVEFGDGPKRGWRGGTWANGTWWLRVSVRYGSVPGYWHNSLGFRCAASE